jgi:hypothetical protein
MDPAGAGAGQWDTELAWHLLTVLLRIGRPAAAAELAAELAATVAVASHVTPQLVERLCRAPGSPLRSSGGAVTVSETAVLAFLRFLGCDAPARPRAGLRAPEARRWCPEVPIRYVRKRKASDAAQFGVKRRLLMETDAGWPCLFSVMGSVQPSVSVSDLRFMSILCRFGRTRAAAVAAADCANLFFSRYWSGMFFTSSNCLPKLTEILRGAACIHD